MGRLSGRRPRIVAALACSLALLLACASGGSGGRRVVHVVQKGETIYRLARYYDVPADKIVRANHIRDVTQISVGRRLVIPGTRKPAPRSSLALASHTPQPGSPSLRDVARREADLVFRWPVRGKLSSRFGWRRGRPHEGIDIAARKGTKVYAAESGKVIHSGGLGGYGRVVIIKHSGRYSTVYAHNRKNRVRKGQFVERGQLIAEVGSTGNASGPHLHFEIRRSSKARDPLRYLR